LIWNPTGNEIVIEERSPEEITRGFGRQTAPDGVKVYNPAFDVTGHELITGFITEKGIIGPPFAENLKALNL
jgi:methylthioribose-1-phosphate isomerase